MASNVPRRATHARIPVHKDENATARTRTLRSKPPSTNGAGASSTTASRVTATTAAARAKAKTLATDAVDQDGQAGKRKRSAFGEVVVNKPKATAKGKDKAEEVEPTKGKFAGVVLNKTKTAAATTTTTTTTRAPLRPTAAAAAVAPVVKRSTRAAVAASTIITAVQAPALVEDAMAIDPPALKAAPRRVVASPRSKNNSLVRPQQQQQPATHARPTAEDVEEEVHRVVKKRRTSSEAPEDPHSEVTQAQVEMQRYLAAIEAEPEADPNGDGWFDLDKDDADDPLMVSEYVADIFEYLKEVEQMSLPNPNYMENQKDLAWKMRGILTDWLIQVHMRFRLLPETLFLAINIIDRFLSTRVVSLAKLQLVGITCMFIAAKVEEIVSPSAADFLRCADSTYSQIEILQAERYILKTLDWNMSYPNPIHFLRRISKADEYNVQVRTIAKYLMEVQCVEWRLIAAPPSLLAAAALWLARLMLGREEWTANLAHYSSYAESSLIPTANLMLNYILKPIRHPSFYKKYASKKFMKASIFARKWALNRWVENTQVQLEEELPSLKALIRVARDRAIEDGLDPDAGNWEELTETLEGR